jgi:hypothetical protein
MASTAGTKMHYDIECYFNGMDVKNDSIEYSYFQNFLKDFPELKPYRTEWMVYYEELKLSGSIDMIFENKWKLLDIDYEENHKKFIRGKPHTGFSDEYFKRKEKYAVQVAEYEANMDELEIKYNKYTKRVVHVGTTFINDNSIKKKISNKEKKLLENETCGICFEKHTHKQIITTQCKHHFGKCCLSKYIDYNFDKYKEITCPICRNEDLTSLNKY